MRDVAQLLAAAVLVLGIGWLVYSWQFGPAGASLLTVQELTGEVRLEGPGGVSAPAVGTELSGDERLVTGGGASRLVLSLGESSRVTVESESTVRVLGSTDAGVQLELEHGRVRATVRPEDGGLQVRADGREISATDAAFALGLDGDGNTELQIGSGEVALTGFDGVSTASGGQRVLAGPGRAMREPIPTSLLLKIDWPDVRTREEETQVSGQTDPGATVRITASGTSQVVKADGTGHFRATITLDEGDNPVDVVATTLMGGERIHTLKITRDSLGPTGVFEVRY